LDLLPLISGDGIHHPDGIFNISEAEGQSQPSQVAVTQSHKKSLPGHPAHFIIKGRPRLSLTLDAKEDEIADCWVDSFHDTFPEDEIPVNHYMPKLAG
jgi:hypothetical protein